MGYSTYFYEQAGLDTSYAFDLSWCQYALGAIGTILSWFLMPRFGRRTLYVWGQGVVSDSPYRNITTSSDADLFPRSWSACSSSSASAAFRRNKATPAHNGLLAPCFSFLRSFTTSALGRSVTASSPKFLPRAFDKRASSSPATSTILVASSIIS